MLGFLATSIGGTLLSNPNDEGFNPLSSIGNITGINLNAPTGGSKVDFEHRRGGWWQGKTVGSVYSVFESMFAQFGKSLKDFGWNNMQAPSTSSKRYKDAQNWFFDHIDEYLLNVKKGDMTKVDRLFNNTYVLQRFNEISNQYTEFTNPDGTTNYVEPINSQNIMNQKIAGFPIWIVLIVAYLILKK